MVGRSDLGRISSALNSLAVFRFAADFSPMRRYRHIGRFACSLEKNVCATPTLLVAEQIPHWFAPFSS